MNKINFKDETFRMKQIKNMHEKRMNKRIKKNYCPTIIEIPPRLSATITNKCDMEEL